ncbi:MAG: S1 RNA-binding domain-containing protein [Archaeoglobi archaeon]|nr:S1 RNA-binding domain-containing protein [Candidatus Mnemosynella sp.]
MAREIVVPGDLLSTDRRKAGEGTYVERGKVYASIYGILDRRGDKIRVIPLAGKYIPSPEDIVIGKIVEIGFSFWNVDINSPYEGVLHISELNRKIDNNRIDEYLNIGDMIIGKVKRIDPAMRVELTLKGEKFFGKITEGRVIEIAHTRVPRVIGRGGSMISLLKKETGCQIYVGQNGRIWIKGDDKSMSILESAIALIEREAHTIGLTEKVQALIRSEKEKLRGDEGATKT